MVHFAPVYNFGSKEIVAWSTSTRTPFPKWLGVGLLVLTVCLGISLIVHAIFQGGLYCKWSF